MDTAKIENGQQLKNELESASIKWGDLTDKAAEIKNEKDRKKLLNFIDKRCTQLSLAERFDAGEESRTLLADYNGLIFDLEEKLREVEVEPELATKKTSFSEFAENYANYYEKNRFSENGGRWMYLLSYDETAGIATIVMGAKGKAGSKKAYSLAELDDFLKKYPNTEDPAKKAEPKVIPKIEVEKAAEPVVASESEKKGVADEKNEKPEEDITTEKITGADLIGEEADKKIAELGKQLEEARKSYIAEDEKAEKIKLSFKSVLWKTLKIGGLGEYEKEHTAVKNRYDEALKTYKDEFLKAGLVEDAEDVKIMVDFLNITETCSREDARIDLRANSSNWWDKASGGYLKIVESYKNIGKDDKSKFVRFAKKALVGVVIGGGVAFAGGAAAGAMGTLAGAMAFRLFTMSVSATGFKGMLEGWADKKRIKDSAKEAENISRNSKIEGVDEMQADLISQNLDQIIAELDKKMQKGKQTAWARSLGAFLSAAVISDLGQMFGREITSSIKEYFSGSQMPVFGGGTASTEHFGGKGGPFENIAKFGGVHPVEAPIVEGAGIIELDPIKTGGSIEGSIREYLESHPDLIEKYNASELSGGRKFDAGQIAFRMFDELSKNHDVVDLPAGTKINLSADGLHIKDIPGLDLDAIHDKVAEGASATATKQPQVEVVPDAEKPKVNVIPSEQATAESLDRANNSAFGKNIDNLLAQLRNDQATFSEDSGPAVSPNPGFGSEWAENVRNNRMFFVLLQKNIFSGDLEKATDIFRKEMTQDGNWDDIKNMTFAEATEKSNWRTSDKISSLFNGLKEVLGNENIRPEINETMEKWTERVIDVAAKQAK